MIDNNTIMIYILKYMLYSLYTRLIMQQNSVCNLATSCLGNLLHDIAYKHPTYSFMNNRNGVAE